MASVCDSKCSSQGCTGDSSSAGGYKCSCSPGYRLTYDQFSNYAQDCKEIGVTTVEVGGNGQGNALDQLANPASTDFLSDGSLLIADYESPVVRLGRGPWSGWGLGEAGTE